MLLFAVLLRQLNISGRSGLVMVVMVSPFHTTEGFHLDISTCIEIYSEEPEQIYWRDRTASLTLKTNFKRFSGHHHLPKAFQWPSSLFAFVKYLQIWCRAQKPICQEASSLPPLVIPSQKVVKPDLTENDGTVQILHFIWIWLLHQLYNLVFLLLFLIKRHIILINHTLGDHAIICAAVYNLSIHSFYVESWPRINSWPVNFKIKWYRRGLTLFIGWDVNPRESRCDK